MTNIYKRGKTSTANILVTVDGQHKRKTKSGFLTKSQANKWSISVEEQKNTGKLP